MWVCSMGWGRVLLGVGGWYGVLCGRVGCYWVWVGSMGWGRVLLGVGGWYGVG